MARYAALLLIQLHIRDTLGAVDLQCQQDGSCREANGAMLLQPATSLTRAREIVEEDPAHEVEVPRASLALYTLMFGNSTWDSKVLPYFLKSVTGAPALTVFIVGDTQPPAHMQPLPKNVKFYEMKVKDLTSKLELALGFEAGRFPQVTYNYKAGTDFKPLIPIIAPEMVRKFAWFGWIDNDVVLSGSAFEDVRAKLAAAWDSSFASNTGHSFGPLTLIRTTSYFDKIVPTLKTNSGVNLLSKMLSRPDVYTNFDENGMFSVNSAHDQFEPRGFNSSFSWILEKVDLEKYDSQMHGALFLPGTQANDAPQQMKPPCVLQFNNGLSVLDAEGKPATWCHFHNRKHFWSEDMVSKQK